MKNEIILYQSDELLEHIEVRLDLDTVWLSLNQIAQLFNRDKSVISRHLSNVYKEGELSQKTTVAKNAIVQVEAGRKGTRDIEFFIFFLMQLLQEMIYKMQTGGAQPHIHPSDLNPILIPFPTKEEQTEIATILFDMDAEITALETKLEKYLNIKLGMMQKLLTGKIRLV